MPTSHRPQHPLHDSVAVVEAVFRHACHVEDDRCDEDVAGPGVGRFEDVEEIGHAVDR